jgi:hypothetical protein
MLPAAEKRQGTKSRSVMHPAVQRALWRFGRFGRRDAIGLKRTAGWFWFKASVFV